MGHSARKPWGIPPVRVVMPRAQARCVCERVARGSTRARARAHALERLQRSECNACVLRSSARVARGSTRGRCDARAYACCCFFRAPEFTADVRVRTSCTEQGRSPQRSRPEDQRSTPARHKARGCVRGVAIGTAGRGDRLREARASVCEQLGTSRQRSASSGEAAAPARSLPLFAHQGATPSFSPPAAICDEFSPPPCTSVSSTKTTPAASRARSATSSMARFASAAERGCSSTAAPRTGSGHAGARDWCMAAGVPRSAGPERESSRQHGCGCMREFSAKRAARVVHAACAARALHCGDGWRGAQAAALMRRARRCM